MKYSEIHKLIKKNGWKYVSASGSHYFYEKNGIKSPPIPFHGTKEMGEGLRKKIIKEMGLD
ncbi:MAG: type II toxin-antitoxin system HicA family toxin [Rikenellaceae bacterium]